MFLVELTQLAMSSDNHIIIMWDKVYHIGYLQHRAIRVALQTLNSLTGDRRLAQTQLSRVRAEETRSNPSDQG